VHACKGAHGVLLCGFTFPMPQIIDTQSKLTSLLAEISQQDMVCAIDTEADSLHRYRESLCLLQLSAAGHNVLIDPLALNDLSELAAYLNSCEVWVHGGDYDMTMLKREFGQLPRIVWDTQIGARLLGVKKFGLSDLVEHWFGVVLQKTSQKADWGKRPLTDKMLDYAINDVNYLLPLGECIVEELHEKGRYDWFVESCEAARKKVLDRVESRDDYWRINGCGRLQPRGLCYLKALWYWRDAEAALWDKPTFMVLNNKDMIDWAETMAGGNPAPIPRHLSRPERLKRFENALASAHAANEEDWPQKCKVLRRRKDSEFDRNLNAILSKRDLLATDLQIDAALLISRSTAESIAAKEVEPLDVLMNWQILLLNL
jgi:ribonuclease D